MKFITQLCLIPFSIGICFSQNITLQELASIESFADETSGIEMADGLFWTHNDSGGDNEIYGFNASGSLIRTITITNATNVDWEELAQDDQGNLYICDFGNNNNNRSVANGTPLRIYKIPNPADIVGNSVSADIIEFDYEDRDLSLTGGEHDFDMEAAFWWNDTLHLFNKIGGDSPSTTVKHYVLPASPGNHTAKIIETINICGASSCANSRKRVTAADISEDGRYVILLTRARMYLFNCFEGSNYLTTGNMREFSFDNTQKEAVVFDTYQDIYITDEKNGPNGGKLYYFSLAPYVFPEIDLTASVEDDCSGGTGAITVNATGGAPSLSYSWDSGQSTSSISNLIAGDYSLTITDNEGCTLDSTFIVNSGGLTSSDAQTICSGTTYTFGSQTLSAAGEYTETFTSVSGCDSTVTLTLTVVEINSTTTLINFQTIQSNQLSASYQWIDCVSENPIAGATENVLIATENGSYAVTVSLDGCSSTSDCLTINTLSTGDSPNGISVVLYPNPVSDILHVTSKEILVGIIQLIDQTGSIVSEYVYDGTSTVIDVTNLANGMYTLQFKDSFVRTVKFVKN